MSKEKNNSTLKIFALLIAIVLWGYVMSDVNPDEQPTFKNINVSFNNLDVLERNNLVLMGPKDATVSVRVNGKKMDMVDFKAKFIKANVDFLGYGEGQVRIPVKAFIEDFNKASIDRIEPADILFTIDRIITPDRPVRIRTEGELPQDYVLGDISTKSQYIQLKGPRTWVNEVAEVVAIVNIDGRTEDASLRATIRLLDDNNEEVLGVTAEPNIIDVEIPIFRTVTVPIELQTEVPENYEITNISIEPSRVKLKGDKNIVYLTSVQTKPVDINLLMEGEKLPVELELPPNVSLLNPDEKITVSLQVQEAYTKTLEYNFNEIEILGLDESLAIDMSTVPESVKIEFKGKEEAITSLTKEDLQPYLDLAIYGEGTHMIYLGVNLPTDLIIKHIEPQPIEIKITSH